jgi:hypothetical protein
MFTTSEKSLITQDYSSRQAKANMKLRLAKAKLELRCRVVAAGSSRRVEDGVNQVISLTAALLRS